jgi:hypothetical protein
MDMGRKTVSIVLAAAGMLVAATIILLHNRLLHNRLGEAGLSVSMLVFMLMLYPLIRTYSTSEIPPVAYLWRDRRLTFPRYLLVQMVAWTLIAVILTFLRRWIGV